MPARLDFVPLEYHIAQKTIYEELIIFQPNDCRFSGTDLQCKNQKMTTGGERKYDVLDLSITCWTDWHWKQIKQEWEENDLGNWHGFEREAHAAKHDASQVKYERQFWFDITEVFDNGTAQSATTSPANTSDLPELTPSVRRIQIASFEQFQCHLM